jgi:hypothetical protein
MAEEKTHETWSYFQYHREKNWPVFVRYKLHELNADFAKGLHELGFVQVVSEADIKKAHAQIEEHAAGRLLTLTEASTALSRQMESTLATDQFGPESVTTKNHYKVYRYKSQAFLVYSLTSKEWQVGVYQNFGKLNETLENKMAMRMVIFRFLSWALAPFGLIGFWAVPVLMKSQEANGEAVFVDLASRLVYTLDGTKKLNGKFQFIRLDNALRDRQIIMGQTELASFLFACTCFLSPEGPSTPIRQLVNALSKSVNAVILPRENFRPRQNVGV